MSSELSIKDYALLTVDGGANMVTEPVRIPKLESGATNITDYIKDLIRETAGALETFHTYNGKLLRQLRMRSPMHIFDTESLDRVFDGGDCEAQPELSGLGQILDNIDNVIRYNNELIREHLSLHGVNVDATLTSADGHSRHMFEIAASVESLVYALSDSLMLAGDRRIRALSKVDAVKLMEFKSEVVALELTYAALHLLSDAISLLM